MTLEITQGTNGKRYMVLTTCPACGYEFENGISRKTHFINAHDPTDFGLTPMEER